ncbi:hypothetical protein H257_16058 [Aphanomyces astaci]|uniref:Uncharacterized protein n=1 Tax=Aphanomyces astaci TaxID=112090 RepID=W4FLP4_APHAT|nr:hypothetical protein H257_16058 [Aphanomyces astaci]ETV67821.1 hypothetical protein H257_16058 [Aphanomyces astaci]|eukprot:XP_009842679.1 hypothetical protein H257_16058 [Aphanomyces astaci]
MASHGNNEAADLEKRVSYIHSNTAQDDDGYVEAKSPKDLEDGALMKGYGAIGIIYNIIPALNYPIFNIYLNLEGYQLSSYKVLTVIGWSFKVIFGLLSDCVPIYGYRRKSWILIGWTVTMICLSVMAFSPFGEPFCNREKTKYCGTPLEKVPKPKLQYFNFSAPDNGTLFILLSMFIAFGYVLAASASDAMVVEYAQREPVAIRIQTAIYTVRSVAGSLAYLVSAFGLNGPNYGGSFSFALSPNAPYGIALGPTVLVIVGKWGLHWNWRWTIAAGTLGMVVVDGFVVFLTIWNVVRNQWFFNGVPYGLRFIVSTYVAVEIADKGNEGSTYSLISTVSNLSGPFASIFYKYVNSYFKVSQNDVKTDTLEVRWDVTYVYFISYGFKIASLFWLFLLPPQKAEVKALKARGGKRKVAGFILVSVFFFCVSFTVSSNIMSIFPSTKCYRVAGGNGVLYPNTGKCPQK